MRLKFRDFSSGQYRMTRGVTSLALAVALDQVKVGGFLIQARIRGSEGSLT